MQNVNIYKITDRKGVELSRVQKLILECFRLLKSSENRNIPEDASNAIFIKREPIRETSEN